MLVNAWNQLAPAADPQLARQGRRINEAPYHVREKDRGMASLLMRSASLAALRSSARQTDAGSIRPWMYMNDGPRRALPLADLSGDPVWMQAGRARTAISNLLT